MGDYIYDDVVMVDYPSDLRYGGELTQELVQQMRQLLASVMQVPREMLYGAPASSLEEGFFSRESS